MQMVKLVLTHANFVLIIENNKINILKWVALAQCTFKSLYKIVWWLFIPFPEHNLP